MRHEAGAGGPAPQPVEAPAVVRDSDAADQLQEL